TDFFQIISRHKKNGKFQRHHQHFLYKIEGLPLPHRLISTVHHHAPTNRKENALLHKNLLNSTFQKYRNISQESSLLILVPSPFPPKKDYSINTKHKPFLHQRLFESQLYHSS